MKDSFKINSGKFERDSKRSCEGKRYLCEGTYVGVLRVAKYPKYARKHNLSKDLLIIQMGKRNEEERKIIYEYF